MKEESPFPGVVIEVNDYMPKKDLLWDVTGFIKSFGMEPQKSTVLESGHRIASRALHALVEYYTKVCDCCGCDGNDAGCEAKTEQILDDVVLVNKRIDIAHIILDRQAMLGRCAKRLNENPSWLSVKSAGNPK